ncbi:hypothetical protein PHAVU_008G149613 [Phaseolus vulgaris]
MAKVVINPERLGNLVHFRQLPQKIPTRELLQDFMSPTRLDDFEARKLFYKELNGKRRGATSQDPPAQVEVVEPLGTVSAGETLPPKDPSSKV